MKCDVLLWTKNDNKIISIKTSEAWRGEEERSEGGAVTDTKF